MATIDQAFIDRVKEMLADDETEDVIDVLLEFFKPVVKTSYYDELIGQAGRLTRLNKRKRQGRMTNETYDVERNVLNDDLVAFINDAYRKARKLANPTQAPAIGVKLDKTVTEDTKEKIVGKSEFRDVVWLKKGMEACKSVCKIDLADGGSGTGFLLKNNLLLTNFHVLKDADFAAYAKVLFHYEKDLMGEVNSYAYSLDPNDFFQNDETLDFALVRIKDREGAPPLSDWGSLSVNMHTVPEYDDLVAIVQHPAGDLKKLAIDRVETVEGHLVKYKTDTLKGSSGSPVFDANWNVVALHHSFVNGEELNQGTLIAAINDFLGAGIIS